MTWRTRDAGGRFPSMPRSPPLSPLRRFLHRLCTALVVSPPEPKNKDRDIGLACVVVKRKLLVDALRRPWRLRPHRCLYHHQPTPWPAIRQVHPRSQEGAPILQPQKCEYYFTSQSQKGNCLPMNDLLSWHVQVHIG
jgi:hypothetical protein